MMIIVVGLWNGRSIIVKPHSGIRKQKIRLGRCKIINKSNTSSFNAALTVFSSWYHFHLLDPFAYSLFRAFSIAGLSSELCRFFGTVFYWLVLQYKSFRYTIDRIIWCLWAQEDNPILCQYINQLSTLLFPEKQETDNQMSMDVVEILVFFFFFYDF